MRSWMLPGRPCWGHRAPKPWRCWRICAPNLRLVLLSNINPIHLQVLRQRLGTPLPWEASLHATYYSCDIGARKPTIAAFETVLEGQDLQPQQTLFVDDLAANVAAAADLGLRTLQLMPGMALGPALGRLRRALRAQRPDA